MPLYLLLSILSALAPSATVVAQEIAQQLDPEQEKRLEHQRLQQELAQLPPVEAQRLAEVVRFSIEGDMLAARTPVSRTNEPLHIVVPGMTLLARMHVYAMGSEPEPGRNFTVELIDVTQPGTLQQRTHVQTVAGRLILARDAESDERSSSVQLIQTTGAMVDPSGVDPPVKLLVRMTDLNTGINQVDLSLSATTFAELRRRHPQEVNRFLRPILRDFGQEAAIFGTDERAQWQVLGSDAPVGPQVERRVREVLAKFDSDDFHERERAAGELESLGQPAALVLARMDRSDLSPEQTSGVDTFLAPYLPLSADEAQALGRSTDFLLDALYSEDAALRKLALARLESHVGERVKFDLNASADARAATIERLRQELSPTSAPAR